ncbi:BAG family molecular chaperone regulator 1A [Wickerhamiella sorbophila]|uniref:BAG family molecular chaperone regulator 1A n=1 Tax=Wickerhamiella sorbophila TaxID=45607 RepID=A0A2T0FK67_9ASCO|nr:BAG family molecular chaperone regulator 1A [Wickerhamiella sorbophila]PRT55369.1 BAG family molecular chaperone regulator 1A [Wickerhamiella sorbophila]
MFGRLASLFGGPKIQYIVVNYEKKEYRITFTAEDYTDNSVTVGSLRNMLAKQFKVPVTHLSLFVLKPQRKMSNNKASLEDYGLINGGTVVAVFKRTDEADPAPAPAPKATTAPLSPKQQLDAVAKAVDAELGEDRINAFIKSPPADAKARDKEYRLLSEIILQNTIKLDNVDVSGSQDLRLERKALINKFHEYHADIDAANEGRTAPSSPSPSPSPKPTGGKKKRKNKKK